MRYLAFYFLLPFVAACSESSFKYTQSNDGFYQKVQGIDFRIQIDSTMNDSIFVLVSNENNFNILLSNLECWINFRTTLTDSSMEKVPLKYVLKVDPQCINDLIPLGAHSVGKFSLKTTVTDTYLISKKDKYWLHGEFFGIIKTDGNVVIKKSNSVLRASSTQVNF